jgi:uncharacterized protein
MNSDLSFQEIQRRFTAYVRAPGINPPPSDVAARRMAVYASLIFKNLNTLLSGCFPVLCSVLPAVLWENLLREFLLQHRARTPLFPRLPCEFLRFLDDRPQLEEEPGFLRELAHYEWLELEVGYDPRELTDSRCDEGADPYSNIPVLNPLARALAYAYPVHRIRPGFVAGPAAELNYLVVFRERDDGVAFMQLTPVTARLVEMMQTNSAAHTGEQLLRALSAEIRHPDPTALLHHGREILGDLQRRQLVLGARWSVHRV